MKSFEMKIGFSVEPAARSVGIMSEGFAAWEIDGTKWCNLVDIEHGACEWFDNEEGDKVMAPPNGALVEAALVAFAKAYYDSRYPSEPDEEPEPTCPDCGVALAVHKHEGCGT